MSALESFQRDNVHKDRSLRAEHPVVEGVKNQHAAVDDPITIPEHPIYRTMRKV